MRAIWKGSISFSLVNIPIALYPATRNEELRFRLLRAKDLSPVNYKRVAEADGKEVPWDEIVKGYEYEKGKFVVLKDDDFQRVDLEVSGLKWRGAVGELRVRRVYVGPANTGTSGKPSCSKSGREAVSGRRTARLADREVADGARQLAPAHAGPTITGVPRGGPKMTAIPGRGRREKGLSRC